MTTRTLPTFFISHGGGPWPWMPEMGSAYADLKASLEQLPQQTGGKPKAVLMVSAHWEEREFTLMANAHPPMVYDYSGFPAHTYRIQYAAPGAPELAQQVKGLLEGAGLAAALDNQRGFDHGMFAPMAVIYPEADVPVLQLSLRRGLDPRQHLAAGHALAPLRDQDVLIIGSGLSYHNLRSFGPAARVPSAAFDQWLGQALAIDDPVRREQALVDWEQAPSARQAHPREEHLLPLMVAVGAAGGDPATRVYHQDDFFGGISVSSFMFARR